MNRAFKMTVSIACLILSLRALGEDKPPSDAGTEMTAPPESFFESVRERDREAARAFYTKHLDVGGLHIVAGAAVDDAALVKTREIVGHMLAGRPDIVAAMQKKGTRLIVIGQDQVYTDMPEYRNHPNPAFQNERVRGTGGFDITSFGEENLLALPVDRYDDESIAVHEFCHTIDAALASIDSTWRDRLRKTYRNAVDKGCWRLAYTGSNATEYWAEIGQSYFDCNRVNNWNHANVGTREQLKQYDPEGYELARTTFNLSPEQDWRYVPVRSRPLVTAPPAKFKADPFYKKFTYAREFVVIASDKVGDAALLKANETIRKLFAYRHDILKALIDAQVRLVVLAPGEQLSDLPEFKALAGDSPPENVRYADYSDRTRLIVLPEENVVHAAGDPFNGASGVVQAFARAVYNICATRPVDPDFEKRPRGVWQQYELRVKRLDADFGKRVEGLFEAAAAKKLWVGTAAAQGPAGYFAAGVLAYFDAAGRGHPPQDADRPITTREALKAYDSELFALVDETFAYKEHVDWRYSPVVAPTPVPYPYSR